MDKSCFLFFNLHWDILFLTTSFSSLIIYGEKMDKIKVKAFFMFRFKKISQPSNIARISIMICYFLHVMAEFVVLSCLQAYQVCILQMIENCFAIHSCVTIPIKVCTSLLSLSSLLPQNIYIALRHKSPSSME